MGNKEWVTEAQARELAREYGASPDEIEREIARDYRGATWYWSPAQRALVSVYDGETTVQDLSDAMARGPLDERQDAMATDFWVMAAQQAHTTASAAQNAASVRADTEGTTQSLAAFLAADDAASITGDILTELQGRAEDLNSVADLVADARIAETIAHSEAVIAMYDELLDRSYHDSLDNNTGRQDEYSDQIWGQAVDLVNNGKTVEEVRATTAAKRAEDDRLEDAYYDEIRAEIGAAEQAQREADGPTGRAWRTAAAITYREYVMDYGNDGRPEDDRHLPASEVAARAMAIATIAGATGVSEGYVFAELRAAAVAEGSAQGFDTYPDYLAPPGWDAFTDRYESWAALRGAAAARHAEPDIGPPAHSVETAEYWLARGEADPGAGLSEEMPPQWTPDRGPHWPVEPQWSSQAGQARLDAKWAADEAEEAAEMPRTAALPAAVTDATRHAPIDAAQQRVIDAAGSVEIARAGVTSDSLGVAAAAEVVAGIDVGQVTGADEVLADMVDAITENSREHHVELAAALHDELADTLDQARPQLAAGYVAEVDRPAHEARIEQLEAQAYPQDYSAADHPYDHALRHGGGADLPPVPAEYTEHPDAYRSGPASAPGSEPAWVHRPAPWGEYAELARLAAELPDNITDDIAGFQATRTTSPDPVAWGSVAADLLDKLDQARAQLEAGDVPAEREHEQVEYIEHLEEQVELAAGGYPFPATSTRWRGADDASAREAPFSADPVLAAHVAELLSDLDGTSGTYPGDNSAYWDAVSAAEEQPPDDLNAATDTAPALYDDGPPLPQQHDDNDGAAAAALAAAESVPDELARGGDPTLAAETAAWMATEAAATEQWLAAETAGFTPVDSHDQMVERRDRDQQYAVHPATNPWNTPAKRDGVGVAPSATAQEEITRDRERDRCDSYGTGDPDPYPGTAVQQPPDEEPPGKARAANAVAAAHQAVADTHRLHTQRAEQGLAAHRLAADDHAGIVGDEVELGSQDEALPPASVR